MTAVFALGDSLTCGRGVGVRVPDHQTWPALLDRSTPGVEVRSFAVPGARIADVRRRQLPAMLAAGATRAIAVHIAGLNDICRAGFDRDRIHRELALTVSTAVDGGAAVVLGRLHDPAAVLGFRGAVRVAIARRLAVVNEAVDAAAAGHGRVWVLDLSGVPSLADRGGWAADRIHPSLAGHQSIAYAAGRLLREAGLAPASGLAPPRPAAGPSALQTVWWALRHGLPYGITHLPDFGPPLIAAMAHRAGAAA